MSEPFILFSAEHTGTNFVNEFLIGLGLMSAGQLERPEFGFSESGHGFPAGGLDYVQIHSTPWRAYEAWGRPLTEFFSRAIIPLRHPHKAYQSKRHIFRDSAPRVVHQEFIKEWQCLIDLSAKFDEVCFVDLETDDRYGTLMRVCEFVGAPDEALCRSYADEWKPVNTHDYEAQDFDLSDLDFAVDWYECQILHCK